MNENTESSLTDILTSTIKEVLPFPCPKCNKPFKNAVALRMHNARVHTKTLGKGYRWKADGMREIEHERLERKRRYQKMLRERYYREGRNSRGEKMPPGWKPRGKGGVVGRKWTPEQLARFRATMKAKNKAKARRIQIVYPDPRETTPEKPRVRKMNFCPYCGEDITRHLSL